MIIQDEKIMRIATFVIILVFMSGCTPVINPDSPSIPMNVSSVCELVKHSKMYNNRRIRISGEIYYGHPGSAISALVEEGCTTDGRIAAMIWLDTADWYNSVKVYNEWTWDGYMRHVNAAKTSGEPLVIPWIILLPIHPMTEDDKKILRQGVGHDSNRMNSGQATIIGRFDYAKVGWLMCDKEGRITYDHGFGHQSSFSRRILVERIESIKWEE